MENNTKIAIGLAAAGVVGYIVYKSSKPKSQIQSGSTPSPSPEVNTTDYTICPDGYTKKIKVVGGVVGIIDICKNYLHAELNFNEVKLEISEEVVIDRFNKTFIYKLDASDNIAFTIRNLKMKNKIVTLCTIAEEPIVTLYFYKNNLIVYNCNGLIDGVYFTKYTDDLGNVSTNKIIITR